MSSSSRRSRGNFSRSVKIGAFLVVQGFRAWPAVLHSSELHRFCFFNLLFQGLPDFLFWRNNGIQNEASNCSWGGMLGPLGSQDLKLLVRGVGDGWSSVSGGET